MAQYSDISQAETMSPSLRSSRPWCSKKEREHKDRKGSKEENVLLAGVSVSSVQSVAESNSSF
jgi:hypothetical protein